MGIKEELQEVKKSINEVRQESFAMELLQDMKKQNKRVHIILIIVLCMWFSTIGVFIYYISNYGYEITTETAETSDSGNACIGDNCNNGVING